MRIKLLSFITLFLLIGAFIFIPTQTFAQYVPTAPQYTSSTSSTVPNLTRMESPYPFPSAATVTIQNFQFQPFEVDVVVGQAVTWTNFDGTSHTTTSPTSNLDSWDSGTIFPGQSYTKTFTVPGVYNYHCNLHPEMHGIVRVSTQASARVQQNTYSPPVVAQPNTSVSHVIYMTPKTNYSFPSIQHQIPAHTFTPPPYPTQYPMPKSVSYTTMLPIHSQNNIIIVILQNGKRYVQQLFASQPTGYYYR